ncbi:Rrf2 family transcriptional regulator [Maritimibacter sp. 55A14]|uniref:RrF2 family transcriptional regulator n=1 Tax=Maritimibacter sp. 55A14 TaxID=2174844 RepID=UPI000D61441A|nr:Rrf2 family transcriptional regulator [Maritimibacter sp. 55A14]PWE33522.1 Rrf2 family transcriptional regulator [Maritimibacter sp. 55A14]
MRLTTRTNLAMRTLMYCAVNATRTVRKSEIAARCNSSENHLAQVVSLMAQKGFLDTVRGRGGGIRLARPAARIAVGDVVRSFEADVPFAECFDPKCNTCPITPHCRLRGAMGGALAAFYGYLDDVSLADLVDGNSGLAGLMAEGADLAALPA